MNSLLQDFRYAARVLFKSPGFAAVAILTLALGIGANTAIFSVVYVSLLRPLPYQQPDRLITLGESRGPGDDGNVASYPDFLDWKRSAKSYQSLAGYGFGAYTLFGNGEPRNVFVTQVTSNFFSTLRVKPALGRDFVDGDYTSDGPRVAILSYASWRTDFGANPDIVGRVYRMDDKTVTIVGVLPRVFEFAPSSIASGFWLPVHPEGDLLTRRSLRWFNVLARLAPGVSLVQARAEMDSITAQLARAYPKEGASIHVAMQSLRDKVVGTIRPLLLVLFGTVGFVLLIACANLANLLLTRSIGRQKEFAVRAALGAGRARLICQLLAESLLLAGLGAVAGILLAQWGVNVLIAAIPDTLLQSMPFLRDASTNIPVLLFVLAITVFTVAIFGLAPGFIVSRSASVGDILKDESRGGTSSTYVRLSNAFVVGEIAVCLVLLVGAGLMLRSFRALLNTNPGFDPHDLLTFNVNLPDSSYPSDREYPFDSLGALRFAHEFEERLRAIPGIEAVALTSTIPMSGNGGSIRFVEEGRPVETGKEDEAQIRTVDSGFFPTMRIPLVRGRLFNDSADSHASHPSLIVNQAFAARYYPNQDIIGKRIRFTFNVKEPYREIVGVVGNIAELDLSQATPPAIYFPNDQGPNTFISFMVRTAGDPAVFLGSIREALQAMDPQLAMIQPQSEEHIESESQGVFLRRYPSYLIGSFAAIALILSIVGLYGQISYSVAQRTREIGIRVALGAQHRDILRLVLRQGVAASLAGVAVGLAAGFGLTRLMASLLYGVSSSDAATFATVAVLMIAVAAVASVVPARRATEVDPIVALRHE